MLIGAFSRKANLVEVKCQHLVFWKSIDAVHQVLPETETSKVRSLLGCRLSQQRCSQHLILELFVWLESNKISASDSHTPCISVISSFLEPDITFCLIHRTGIAIYESILIDVSQSLHAIDISFLGSLGEILNLLVDFPDDGHLFIILIDRLSIFMASKHGFNCGLDLCQGRGRGSQAVLDRTPGEW